jgi:hypothetical protein
MDVNGDYKPTNITEGGPPCTTTIHYNVGPPFTRAKSGVNNSNIDWVYGRYIEPVNGVYK